MLQEMNENFVCPICLKHSKYAITPFKYTERSKIDEITNDDIINMINIRKEILHNGISNVDKQLQLKYQEKFKLLRVCNASITIEGVLAHMVFDRFMSQRTKCKGCTLSLMMIMFNDTKQLLSVDELELILLQFIINIVNKNILQKRLNIVREFDNKHTEQQLTNKTDRIVAINEAISSGIFVTGSGELNQTKLANFLGISRRTVCNLINSHKKQSPTKKTTKVGDIINIKEASEYLGISRGTLWSLTKQGKIKKIELNKRVSQYERIELDRFANSQLKKQHKG